MSWFRYSVDRYEVRALDETVMMFCYNDKNEKIAAIDFDVEGAEECIKELQEAIEEAKKSKYYQAKGE